MRLTREERELRALLLGLPTKMPREDRLPGKERIRRLHRQQRLAGFAQLDGTFGDSTQLLCRNLCRPEDLCITGITPHLIPVEPSTEGSRLFAAATLTWSVPVSQGFGRRMRFLVRDDRNGKLIGIIPVIAVLEEAQSVLGKSARDESPFVQWAKEGRKYSLGAMLVTQQPGSIAPELLSQGDNFFAFHLLSAHDLKTLQFHNAHFSDDVLAHLLNEPIRGNTYFWSAPHQPFVLPARIRSFESEYKAASRDQLSEPVRTELEAVMSSEENLISRLAVEVREMIVSGSAGVAGVAGDESVFVVYKPRLAAKVGELMSNAEKTEYCGGGEDNRTFVCDAILDRIVVATGLCGSTPDRIKGKREDQRKPGDFYRFRQEHLSSGAAPSGTVELC